MSAIPLMKLMSLTIRTVAKPISKLLKTQATTHPTLRNNVVVPVGQATHWISVRLQRLTMNSSRRDVKPLSEELAVNYGAEFIGEFFIFSVATLVLVGEYNSSAAKSAQKEAKLQETLAGLRADIDELKQRHESTQRQVDSMVASLEQDRQLLREVHQRLQQSAPSQASGSRDTQADGPARSSIWPFR